MPGAIRRLKKAEAWGLKVPRPSKVLSYPTTDVAQAYRETVGQFTRYVAVLANAALMEDDAEDRAAGLEEPVIHVRGHVGRPRGRRGVRRDNKFGAEVRAAAAAMGEELSVPELAKTFGVTRQAIYYHLELSKGGTVK